ncbi:unnamed protein product, partial [Prorocentrum cordatum]
SPRSPVQPEKVQRPRAGAASSGRSEAERLATEDGARGERDEGNFQRPAPGGRGQVPGVLSGFHRYGQVLLHQRLQRGPRVPEGLHRDQHVAQQVRGRPLRASRWGRWPDRRVTRARPNGQGSALSSSELVASDVLERRSQGAGLLFETPTSRACALFSGGGGLLNGRLRLRELRSRSRQEGTAGRPQWFQGAHAVCAWLGPLCRMLGASFPHLLRGGRRRIPNPSPCGWVYPDRPPRPPRLGCRGQLFTKVCCVRFNDCPSAARQRAPRWRRVYACSSRLRWCRGQRADRTCPRGRQTVRPATVGL